jgi:hypothetical protein
MTMSSSKILSSQFLNVSFQQLKVSPAAVMKRGTA